MTESLNGMANTSSRTLRLLSLLQTRRYWPGPLLADRLEVSPRTLRRDVERLRDLGYPVDANPGVDGGYALAPGAALPPLVIDDDEAMALAVAIQSQLAAGGGDDAGLRALTKIIQVMPRRLRLRLDAGRSATTAAPLGSTDDTLRVDHQVLTTLALGCRDSERVQLDYRAANGSRSTRRVEPYRLVPSGRRWYVVCYDLDRGDWRTFRIDRIVSAQGSGVPFGPRALPFDDVAEFVRSRVQGGSGGRVHVEAIVHASAETVTAKVGHWARATPRPDGTCTMTMETDDLDGPLYALGAIGADFEVVAPPELVAQAADWGSRFARAAAVTS